MNKFVGITVGQPYPLQIPPAEGAFAEFLRDGNRLIIRMDGMDKTELLAAKKGPIKAGFRYEAGALLWCFQIYWQSQLIISLECPFDARLIPREQIQLHTITNRVDRLAIEIYVIDNGITAAIRAITMPNAQTLLFLAAVQDQITSADNGKDNLERWLKMPPKDLVRTIYFYRWGE